MVQQLVLPIKDSNVLTSVQETLLDSFRAGRRNYTIFQLGKATLLRVSDVMQLKKVDVFNADGMVRLSKIRLSTTKRRVKLTLFISNQCRLYINLLEIFFH